MLTIVHVPHIILCMLLPIHTSSTECTNVDYTLWCGIALLCRWAWVNSAFITEHGAKNTSTTVYKCTQATHRVQQVESAYAQPKLWAFNCASLVYVCRAKWESWNKTTSYLKSSDWRPPTESNISPVSLHHVKDNEESRPAPTISIFALCLTYEPQTHTMPVAPWLAHLPGNRLVLPVLHDLHSGGQVTTFTIKYIYTWTYT